MQHLKEPSTENIDSLVVNPGTHYLHVDPKDVPTIRTRIYTAASRTGQFIAHTHYDKNKHQLRVVVEN